MPKQVNSAAGKILMKALWLGRLARPDKIKPIGDLASAFKNGRVKMIGNWLG